MSKPPPPGPKDPGAPPPDDDTLTTGFYEAAPTEISPPEGEKEPSLENLIQEEIHHGSTDPQWAEGSSPGMGGGPEPGDEPPERPRRGSPAVLKVAAVVAVAALAAGAALVYRGHHRKQVLTQGMARARELVLPDTFAGYRDAAAVLEPLVPIDPIEAGSLRSFALAMLYADYRDEAAGQAAEALLLEPERAAVVPPAANLARAALAVGRREAGTALGFATRPGGGVWAATVQGRLALLAGNPTLALPPLGDALKAEPRFPAALALQGDALRRSKRFELARETYAAALAASPTHPRAAYGMAKLALSGRAKPEEATPALERLIADRSGTPSNERARAALHLAALRARAGDRGGAAAAMDAAGVEGADRAWLEKAVTEEELSRTGYRTVAGAPAAIQSASDDDPYEPPPPATAAPAKPKKEAKAAKAKPSPKKKAKPSKATPAKKSKAKAKAAPKKASAKKATVKKAGDKKATSRKKTSKTSTATPAQP
jgi:tetratricopeptide (TPR) repeat protein